MFLLHFVGEAVRVCVLLLTLVVYGVLYNIDIDASHHRVDTWYNMQHFLWIFFFSSESSSSSRSSLAVVLCVCFFFSFLFVYSICLLAACCNSTISYTKQRHFGSLSIYLRLPCVCVCDFSFSRLVILCSCFSHLMWWNALHEPIFLNLLSLICVRLLPLLLFSHSLPPVFPSHTHSRHRWQESLVASSIIIFSFRVCVSV